MKLTETKRKALRDKCNGKCYYCGLPMLENSPGAKTKWLRKHGLTQEPLLGARAFIRNSRETVEHLTKKADGGPNTIDNLVMAHHFCNTYRGDATPGQHKFHMSKEIENPLSPLYVIANFYGRGE